MQKWNSSYEILDKEELIIESHKGVFEVSKLIEFREKQANVIQQKKHYNLLIDIRETKLEFSYHEIQIYGSLIIDHPTSQLNLQRQTAILTNTPQQVALFTLFKENQKLKKMEIFSTGLEALKWLGITIKESDFTLLIETVVN